MLLCVGAGHAADDLAPARAAIAQQDFETAVALLEDGRQRPPASAESSYLFGLALKGTGRTEAALTAFEQALAQRPRHVEALREAGWTYLELGRLAEAEAAFRRGLEQEPRQPAAFYCGLGRVKMETDSLRSARLWLVRSAAEDATNPACHKALGDLYTRLGTTDLALAEYDQALALGLDRESLARVRYAIGKLHARQQRWAEAAEAWQQALAADSSFAPAYADLASRYLTLDPPRHYDDAVPLLQQLVVLRPDDPALEAKLARVMAQSPRYSGQALPVLESAAERNPGDITLPLWIGKLSWRAVDLGRALEAYRQAAQMDPNHPGVLEGLAAAQKAAGDTAAAIATLQQMASLDSSSAGRERVAGALGVLLYEQERYAEAIPHLKEKLNTAPDVPVLYRLLGLCYIRVEDYASVMSEVKPALDRAVAAYPAVPRLGAEYVVLANEMYSAGRYDDAIALFQERLKQEPASGSLYLNIGFAHFVQKEYGQALPALRKAVQYQPDNAQAHLYEGACLRITGDHEQAKAAFLKAAKLDPRSAEALKQSGLSLLLEAQSLQQAGKHEQSQQQAEQAVGYLQRAVAVKADVQARVWLAQGYALSRQLDKAREEFNRVLRMDPANADARSGLERVQG